jgi:7-carboxy-7-deazaguanine synthase
MIQNQNDKLNLVEIYSSLQGETSRTGLPTTFIRLSACNLRCVWCDTAYSFGKGTPTLLTDIFAEVDRFGCKDICVTGGEPLLQENVYPLMQELCNRGHVINLETSGSLATSRVDPRVHIILDIKCPGSQMSHKNHWPNLDSIAHKDEVKFVLLNREDYNYSKDICLKFDLWQKTNVLFSPVHSELDPKELMTWILADKLPARLNLQIHKYIWPVSTRGV